jgi:hypothetical protein
MISGAGGSCAYPPPFLFQIEKSPVGWAIHSGSCLQTFNVGPARFFLVYQCVLGHEH